METNNYTGKFLLWEQRVAGSNPVVPTIQTPHIHGLFRQNPIWIIEEAKYLKIPKNTPLSGHQTVENLWKGSAEGAA
jgi:hypothetical protein